MNLSDIYIYICFVPSKKVVEQLRGCLLSTKPVDRHRHSDVELTISPLSATFSAGRLPATFQASDSSKLGWWFSRPKGASPQPNQHFGPKIPEISRQWGVQRHSFCGSISITGLQSFSAGRPDDLESQGPNHLALGQLYEPNIAWKSYISAMSYMFFCTILDWRVQWKPPNSVDRWFFTIALCLRTMAVHPIKWRFNHRHTQWLGGVQGSVRWTGSQHIIHCIKTKYSHQIVTSVIRNFKPLSLDQDSICDPLLQWQLLQLSSSHKSFIATITLYYFCHLSAHAPWIK